MGGLHDFLRIVGRLARALLVAVLFPLVGVSMIGAAPVGTRVAQAVVSPPAGHVVLVDWDGFDPDYLATADTPILDDLVRRGSLTRYATASYRTTSNPSRATMSTGAWPEVHRNIAYVFDEQSGLVRGQNRFLGAETVAQALAEAGLTVASVQWYMVQDHGVTYGDPDHLYVQPGGPCRTRVDTALAILDGSPVDSGGQPVVVPEMPNLLAVYCDDLDAGGHEVGADDPGLGRTLEEMDRQLGRLVEKVRQVGALESTTFVLTGDHGMTSWNRSLLPAVLAELTAAGFTPEIVTPGQGPAPSSDLVIVPNSRRAGAFSLWGAADTPGARDRLVATLQAMPQIERVIGPDELRALHASKDEGDVIAEAAVPFAFAQSEPPPGQWRGAHGSLAERRVPLLFAGAAIRPGAAPDDPRLVDLAPTITTLLGVPAPDQTQGRPLREILQDHRR